MKRLGLGLCAFVIGCGAAPLKVESTPMSAGAFDQTVASKGGLRQFTRLNNATSLSLDSTYPSHDDFTWQVDSERIVDSGLIKTERLYFRDIPVQGAHIKSHLALNSIWQTGALPDLTQPGEEPGLIFKIGEDEMRAKLEQTGFRTPVPIGKQVYFADNKRLVPAYVYILSNETNDLPKKITFSAIDGRELNQEPYGFSMTSQAKLYEENRVASGGVLKAINLPNLLSPTVLENTYFKVLSCDTKTDVPLEPSTTNCIHSIKSSLGEFVTDPNQKSFDEVMGFYAISRGIAWNQRMGSLWSANSASGWNRESLGFDKSPLTVFVRALTKTNSGNPTYANAQYLPGGVSGGENPAIVVGTGWEDFGPQSKSSRALQRLGKDLDVFMHEFHHHIVYHSITTTIGESLVLHESLADFFTYSITGNNLLCESIVPSDAVKGALRHGKVAGTYVNFGTGVDTYKRAEFMSSVFWDIRMKLGQWKDDLWKTDKIFWDAVDLASDSENIQGFLAALARSADVFAAQNPGEDAATLKAAMTEIFQTRGLLGGSQSLPVTDTPLSGDPVVNPNQNQPSGDEYSRGSNSNEKTGGLCGVVAGNSQKTPLLILVFSLLIPIFFLRKPHAWATIPIRSRNFSKRK